MQCSRAAERDKSRLLIDVDIHQSFPPLPAAVEVAAYRIVQEALTNVIRHACAHRCSVRLSLDDELVVEVVDDGGGLPENVRRRNGLGLISMRERAEELGGTCIIESRMEGGTRVIASLPTSELNANELIIHTHR